MEYDVKFHSLKLKYYIFDSLSINEFEIDMKIGAHKRLQVNLRPRFDKHPYQLL